ncbi:hypothetical protein [Butyricimonas paravirosa]
MGAFLFSTRKVDSAKVVDVLKSRGHKIIGVESAINTTLVYAPKILVDNVNYLSSDELGGDKDDFICGIGTYFYKNCYGIDALKLVFSDLEVVLENKPVYGHWAFVVRKNSVTYVFNDMSGTMRLYYQQDESGIVVSSSMVSVLASIENPKFDKVRLGAFIASGYGNEIPFVEGIECVDPLKVLVIKDGKSPKWIDRKEPEIPRINTLEEAVVHCKQLFAEQMNVIRSAIGDEEVGIELTAGLDSCLIASSIKSSGFNYNFVNYPLYGPDSEVANLIAEGLHKEVHVIANEPAKDNAASRYGEFDFGFDFYRQYCSNRWQIKNKFQFSGARGECIDTPDMYSDEDITMMNDPRLSVLLEPLCVRNELTPKYKKLYLDYLKKVYTSRGFDINISLSEKEQVRFNQMMAGQFTGDYMYNSGVQAHLYFYQIYNEYHFNHFIMDIALEAKSGRKLTLALIKAIDSELASFPFVSRRRTRMNSVAEVSELPIQYKSYNGIKRILPKFVVNFLFGRMGRKYDVKRLRSVDLSLYREVVNIDKYKKYPNMYSSYLNRLSSVEVLRKKFSIQ